MPAYCSWLRLFRSGLGSVALVIIVNACGYHLRGDFTIEQQYLPIKVVDTGVSAEIKPRIIRQLNEANIPIVEDDSARLLITIQGVEFDRRLVSAANQATIDTYEIGMRLRYKFSSAGKDLLTWQDLRISRILQFSKSAVVSSATEESTLRDDLLSDAIHQIVTRLRYLDQLEPIEPENKDKAEVPAASNPNQAEVESPKTDAANSDAANSDSANSDANKADVNEP